MGACAFGSQREGGRQGGREGMHVPGDLEDDVVVLHCGSVMMR